FLASHSHAASLRRDTRKLSHPSDRRTLSDGYRTRLRTLLTTCPNRVTSTPVWLRGVRSQPRCGLRGEYVRLADALRRLPDAASDTSYDLPEPRDLNPGAAAAGRAVIGRRAKRATSCPRSTGAASPSRSTASSCASTARRPQTRRSPKCGERSADRRA